MSVESHSSDSTPVSSSQNEGSAEGASQTPAEAFENAEQVGSNSFEVVIDGETVTLSLDELKAGYQKAKSSAKRYQEAAEERKQAAAEKKAAEEFKSKLLQNPFKALMEAGVDIGSARKHYESVVWEMLQQDQLTPEQKAELKAKQEFETEKQRIAREKEEIEAWKKERAREQEEQEVRKHQETYATMINEAISKHGLPGSPEVVAKMAGYMSQALEHGYELSIDDAAAMYKEETESGLKSLLGKYSPEQLMGLLGDEGLKALRAKDLEQVKNPASVRKPSVSSPAKPSDKKISARDFFKNLK